MGSEKMGKVTVVVDEKIPGVFGDYSSLGVTIGLEIPGNVDKFEAEIDVFTKRLVTKIQSMANEIAAASGVQLPWDKKTKK
jgi:hypothetical protein